MKKHLHAPMDKNAIIVILSALVIALSLMLWGNQVFHPEAEVKNQNTLIEDSIQSDVEYALIPEFGLKYKRLPENVKIKYTYVSGEDWRENWIKKGYGVYDDPALYLGGVTFTYVPSMQEDTTWAKCILPSINEYGKDPTGLSLNSQVKDVRKIGEKYYHYTADLHEPCSSTEGDVISGDAEKAWLTHRAAVRDIFDSLLEE